MKGKAMTHAEFENAIKGRKLYVWVVAFVGHEDGEYIQAIKADFLAVCSQNTLRIDARIEGDKVYVG